MAALGLLGRKIGMTQIFDEKGAAVPVTVIEAGPCPVLTVRSVDRDGYQAVHCFEIGCTDIDPNWQVDKLVLHFYPATMTNSYVPLVVVQ